MTQTRFTVDAHTAQVLGDLQKTFGVTSNAEVLRRAVALARVAARHAGPARTVVIQGADEPADSAEIIRLGR